MAEDEYSESTHWFSERRDGTWELRSTEAGKPVLIFETRAKAIEFAESLMDEEGPCKTVFESKGRKPKQGRA